MYMRTMECDLQRPAKTERGQRDVDFPELLQEGTYFRRRDSRYKWTPRRWHRVYIQVAESRMSIHIILLPCIPTLTDWWVVKEQTNPHYPCIVIFAHRTRVSIIWWWYVQCGKNGLKTVHILRYVEKSWPLSSGVVSIYKLWCTAYISVSTDF